MLKPKDDCTFVKKRCLNLYNHLADERTNLLHDAVTF